MMTTCPAAMNTAGMYPVMTVRMPDAFEAKGRRGSGRKISHVMSAPTNVASAMKNGAKP